MLKVLFPGMETLYINTPKIGPRLFIQHGFATNISAKQIGSDCWINQQVTIGYTFAPDPPIIGNGVRVSAGAKVIGNITIGDNAIIAARITFANISLLQELEEIHNKMETELGLQGAYLDAIYYCPHHPHKGYEGEVPELKIECDCRKPKPGMLLKAAIDYNIDLSQSYMIGDGENDIKAGMAAGCKAILVNGNGTDTKNEDFGQVDTLSSVLEFVDKYLH